MEEQRNGRHFLYVSYSRKGSYDLTEEGKRIGTFDRFKDLRKYIRGRVDNGEGVEVKAVRGIPRKEARSLENLTN